MSVKLCFLGGVFGGLFFVVFFCLKSQIITNLLLDRLNDDTWYPKGQRSASICYANVLTKHFTCPY